MPVALLLQNMINALKASAVALSPWTEIVTLEATIVERARSAFLMHWFGHRLPIDGLSLRAHIVNIGELDRQFLAAQRSVLTSQGGPNLTEPLLGFAGNLVGLVLSPMGMIAGLSVLLRFVGFSLGVLGTALLWVASLLVTGLIGVLVFGLVVAPAGTAILVGGGLAGLGMGFALAAAVGEDRPLRAVFDVFGALARFMNAAVIFLGQLTGPRAEVRNPLLRKVLDLADRFAGLLSQVLGALAVVVKRIAPVLEPVARTLVALGPLASEVIAALGVVVSGLMSRVDDLRAGPLSVTSLVRRVIAVAREQIRKVTSLVTGQVDVLSAAFAAVQNTVSGELDKFAGEVGEFVVGLFTGHTTVKVVMALSDQVAAITKAFKETPPPPPPPTVEPSPIQPLLDALPAAPAIRSFPDLPELPDAVGLRVRFRWWAVPPLDMPSIVRAAEDLGRADFEAPIELSDQARAAVARMGRRQSVFAADRRALAIEVAGSPEQALLNVQERERFRQAFAVIVGRVLPPELRGTAIPTLVDPEQLPVLDLSESDELAPVVKKLRLHMPGANVNDVKRFQDLVTERIQRRSYRVGPASGGR